MTDIPNLTQAVTGVLRQLPQWVGTDLGSKDVGLRERAEDALAAMIGSVLAEAKRVTVVEPSRH